MIYNITHNSESEIHAFCCVCGKVNIFQKDIEQNLQDALMHQYYKTEHELCYQAYLKADPHEQIKLGTVIIGTGRTFKNSEFRVNPNNISQNQLEKDIKASELLLF